MKIRIAKKEDYKELQKLNYLLFKKEYEEYWPTLNTNWPFEKVGEEYFNKVLTDQDKYLTLIAEEGGEAIGYLIGLFLGEQKHRKQVTSVELGNMFVIEEWRSKGVGGKLIDELAKWGKSKGANAIKVAAHSKNTRGINFYNKNGFEDYVTLLERRLK